MYNFTKLLFQDVEYEQLPADKMTSMSSVLLLSFRNIRRVLTSKTKSPPGAEQLAHRLFDIRQDDKTGNRNMMGSMFDSMFDIRQVEKTGNRNMRGRVSWDGRLRML